MAAVTRSGNIVYVTAAGDVYSSTSPVTVVGVIISPAVHGSGSPSITLVDQSPSPGTKLKLCTPNTTTTPIYLKDAPVQFYGGFSVSALSGAVATIILQGG